MTPSSELPDDEIARFEAAVAIANLPTLLMVLVQLTGDLRWLEPPYRPARPKGVDDNDSGGLAEPVQREIRTAALGAILAWRAGRPAAMPDPDPELLVRMLSVAMAEPIPEEYGGMTRAQLGQRPLDQPPISVPDGFRVLVVGAGASGMCMGIHLKAAGVPFTIVEKSATVGGTWRDNRYPGAGVDTPNHLYSFSFLMRDWSMYFALGDELYAYMEEVADHYELREHIEFESEVSAMVWDSARRDWAVTIRAPDGVEREERAAMVVSAVGIFNPPVMPDIPGLDGFGGICFHSSCWPDDLDIRGKRVAVIGNGASAMQICPEIQHEVESLTIFQQTPHWATPFPHFRNKVPDPIRFLLREVPLYQAWYRVRLGWTFNDRVHASLQKDPEWPHGSRSLNAANDAHRRMLTEYIREQLGDRQDLLEQVLPTYPPFGKRMLMDNGWYRMLRNPRVKLVSDRIDKIDSRAIETTAGERHEADVLVIATGFDVLRFINTFEAIGRDGRSLRDTWNDDDARAYLGTAVPGFPNFFMLYGPNTQPGHGGSLLFVIEQQVHYLMDLLRKAQAEGVTTMECRQDAHDDYNAAVEAAHERMVWTHPGMQTYYRNRHGRVTVNIPYRNVDLYRMTREAKLEDYRVETSD